MSTLVTAALAAALWLGCLLPLPGWAAAVALAALVVAVPCSGRGRSLTALVLVLVGMLLLGGGLAGGRGDLRDGSPLAGLARRRAVVDLVGRVATEPRRTAIGGWVLLRVSGASGTRLAGRVVLHMDRGDSLEVGQRVRARMRVVPLPAGGFGSHLRTLGASAGARPVGALQVAAAPAVLRWTTLARDRAQRAFANALDADRAALLGALVLGSRDGIDDDQLRAAGLVHLVVVSGRHVAVLLAGVLLLAALCGLGHRGRQRTALIALWWFVLLTRWQPSVLRAAVMATLVIAAALSGRGRDALHSLAVTVMLLLLCDPLLARQAGFALSVLATGGVLVAVQRGQHDGSRVAPVVLRVTVAAQLATAPVLLTMVDAIPSAAVPANLVAAPAATVAQTVGLCAAVLAATGLPGAVLLAHIAGRPLAVLEWAATAFVGLPSLDAVDLIAVVVSGACVALAVRRSHHRRRLARWALAITAVAVVVVVVTPLVVPPRAPLHLRLTVADIGQGDALIVEAPDGDDGARMLVDGGPEPGPLDTILRRRRIRTIDAVVLTHGDHDHAGGLARVLRRLQVGVFVIPAGDPALVDASASTREALTAARDRDVPVVEVADGQRFALGSARVDVLAPAAGVTADMDRNARSIVLHVTGAHGDMLLTGDAEAVTQARLLGRAQIHADVLKVPHHGGATNAPGFLDAVRAQVAVVSVGADNGYGHPHPDTVADVAPVPLWRTDLHGTVTVTLAPAGPLVSAERHP